jgi:hypothetical protein
MPDPLLFYPSMTSDRAHTCVAKRAAKLARHSLPLESAQSALRLLKCADRLFMHKPGRDDIRSQPAYPLTETARYLKVAPATLRSWTVGRRYPTSDGVGRFRPLIHPPGRQPPVLSFWNLIEAMCFARCGSSMESQWTPCRPKHTPALRYCQFCEGSDRVNGHS